jgi:hypothetical protein
MLSDNRIFRVVIVISQISIKNIRAVKKKLRKKCFLFSRGMDLASSAGISLRNRVVRNFFFKTHSQAKTHREACGGG